MSLTSQLRNPNSALNQMLNDLDIRQRATEFVMQHNDHLAQLTPIVSDYWQQSDWALVGMSTVYLMALIKGSTDTLVHRRYPHVVPFLETLSLSQSAILCGLLDKHYRRGNKPDLLQIVSGALQLPSGDGVYDTTDQVVVNKIKASIADIELLIPNIENFVATQSHRDKWQFQATFMSSASVGGADANLLWDGNTIVDIRTTRKHRPMTADSLIQQIMYAVLAYPEMTVNSLGFYYSRHDVYVEYPVYNLPQLSEAYELVEDYQLSRSI